VSTLVRTPPSGVDAHRRVLLPADKALIWLVCLAAPLTNVKFADIQIVECFGGLFATILLVLVWHGRIDLKTIPQLARLARGYAFFMALAWMGALAAQRLPFSVPDGVSVFKRPPLLSVARLTQLTIAVTLMLTVSNLLLRKRKLIYDLARAYVVFGVVNALYAIASFVARMVGLVPNNYDSLFGAYTDWGFTRARGFFVEGGPFGLYVVTVLLVLIFLRYVLRGCSGIAFAVGGVLLMVAFALASSKAGLCLGAAIGTWYLWRPRKMRNIAVGLAVMAGVFAWIAMTGSSDQFMGYVDSYSQFDRLVISDPSNGNLVMGRVAALYVVPEMVSEHPLLGVGLGNYSVARNSPALSAFIPSAPGWDLPGLGLLGYSAELGIPLLIYLAFLLWQPVRIAKRKLVRRQPFVIVLAGCQFFVHVFGAQITFAYPWLVTSLVLGYVLNPSFTGALNQKQG
jgi:hypothetical protein